MTEPELPTDGATRHPLPSDLLHDLRTPLNHIIGYSEMLMEQAQEQGQDDFVPDLQRTHAAGKELLALINDHFHPIFVPDVSGGLVVESELETGVEPGDMVDAIGFPHCGALRADPSGWRRPEDRPARSA